MKNSISLLVCISVIAFVILCTPLPGSAQSVYTTIDLNDNDPLGIPDNPFGIQVSPDGAHALVPIFGHFTSYNNRVAVIDLSTLTVTKSTTVEEGPEEVVFTKIPAGGVRNAYITNSTSGSVSVLDASYDVVTTISLGEFTYPFGMAVNPAQTHLYVGTVGGTGELFVIDVDPGSPTLHTVVDTIVVPGAHGRPAFFGPTQLVIPASDIDPGWAWSQAKLVILDPADPGTQDTLYLSEQSALFPSAQDVAVLSDGRAYVAISGYNSYVYVIDVASRTLLDLIDLGAFAESQQHGICTSLDERFIYVTSFVNNVVSVIREKDHTVAANLNVGAEPNEVAFNLDTSLAFVTNQTSQSISVIKEIPEGPLNLTGPTFVSLGSSFNLTISGGRAGKTFGLVFSPVGLGNASYLGVPLEILGPHTLLKMGFLRKSGGFTTMNYSVPSDPALQGAAGYFQAAALGEDALFYVSNVHTVLLQ